MQSETWPDERDDDDEQDDEDGEYTPDIPVESILTLICGGRVFGLRAADVGEIAAPLPYVPLPDSPPWILGIASLRERLIPFIDLRARLGLSATAPDQRPCVVVTRGESLPLALLIGEVRDIVNLPPDRIQPPPARGALGFVSGIGHLGDCVAVLIDPARLLDEAEQSILRAAVEAAFAAGEQARKQN